MTKSTITRERLQELAEGQSGFNLRTATHEESQELARIALAAMDSEPVAWTWHYREQWHVTNDERRASFVAKDGDVAVLPLYRHAQQPVELANIALPHSWLDGEGVEVMSANEVKRACRTAMLAAAPQSPGSEPATVPGKWIPVSERMPEIGDIVLTAMGGVVNVGEMECSAANCLFFTSVISGRELPATHWMPLPAAPQEGK